MSEGGADQDLRHLPPPPAPSRPWPPSPAPKGRRPLLGVILAVGLSLVGCYMVVVGASDQSGLPGEESQFNWSAIIVMWVLIIAVSTVIGVWVASPGVRTRFHQFIALLRDESPSEDDTREDQPHRLEAPAVDFRSLPPPPVRPLAGLAAEPWPTALVASGMIDFGIAAGSAFLGMMLAANQPDAESAEQMAPIALGIIVLGLLAGVGAGAALFVTSRRRRRRALEG